MDVHINANESLYETIEKINENTYKVCYATPPRIVSDGFWANENLGRYPLKSFLPIFEMQVLVIFVVTQICHFLFKRLNLPLFIPQMMAGLILGPSLHIELLDKYKKILFPYGSQDVLATVSSVGYAFYLFLAGVQMDFSMITRTGHKAWAIALIGLLAPVFISLPTASFIVRPSFNITGKTVFDLPVVVLTHTVLSFAVIASLLNELKILNSELGKLALSSALVSEVVSTSIASVNTAMWITTNHVERVINLLSLIGLGVLVPLVCRPAMFWIINKTPEGRPVRNGYTYAIISMVLFLGYLSVIVNQDFTLGTFALGLAVPEGPPLGSELVKKLEFFSTYFFLPIFVTCSVMKADLSLVRSTKSIIVLGSVILHTHVIKISACTIPAAFCKMPWKDALALGLILNYKGIVDLCLISGLYDQEALTGETYGLMVVNIMIIAITVKWSVKLLYDPSRKYAGYQKRNIMSLKTDLELRIVASIHKQCHLSPIIDVLDLCCPTTEHPIIVDVLHLVELVGRSAPIFIPHNFQRLNLGSYKSYSDDVILAFNLYEHDNRGAASAHTYTAISPPSLMHEDVCQLALDKNASIIILPFHQRWSIDGEIESNDKNIQSLNCKVLEIAPCSVGILVSRSSLQSNSCIRLAVVFLGGKDDREAMCLAKRAMKDPRINIVVYHLLVTGCFPIIDDLMDNVVLEDIKQAKDGSARVSYKEIISNDGPETSLILRDIAHEHDFFIVGRRHEADLPQTHGLVQWCEFLELGLVGDLLASPDFKSKASVLVVQQQVQDKK